MKKLLYILSIIGYIHLLNLFSSCAGEGKNYEYLEETFEEDTLIIDLVKHVDSMVIQLEPTVEKSKETEIAVKETAKREKKLKKELKRTQKELKKVKKNLKEVKEELAQVKKKAGKKNLIQKVFNMEVDSVVVDETVEKQNAKL